MHLPGIIQKIQIQRTRSIWNGTDTSESRFHFVQKCHESKGLKPGAHRRDRIHKKWAVGIRPSLGFVERRDSGDFDP